jgi:hypothetical protein
MYFSPPETVYSADFQFSHFLYPYDVTQKRMEVVSTKLGRTPRTLFQAACDPSLESRFISTIEDAIASTTLTEIEMIIGDLGIGDSAPHDIFEISPGDQTQRFRDVRVMPISDWAMHLILQQNEITNAENIWKTFLLFSSFASGKSMASKIWELAVHQYFCHHKDNLIIKRLLRVDATSSKPTHLNDSEYILTISNMTIRVCETDKELKKNLWHHFREETSCYLKLKSGTFGGINSLLFRPGEPIMFFQFTIAPQQTITIFGLERALLWMDPPDDSANEDKNIFRKYHPEIGRWQIVLVVDNGMPVAHWHWQEQQLTVQIPSHTKMAELHNNIDKWRGHMEQYVMELKSTDVFLAVRQLN